MSVPTWNPNNNDVGSSQPISSVKSRVPVWTDPVTVTPQVNLTRMPVPQLTDFKDVKPSIIPALKTTVSDTTQSISPNAKPGKIPGANNISQPQTDNAYTTYAPSTMKTLSDLQIDPLSLKGGIQNTVNDYVKAFQGSIANERENVKQTITAPTLSGKVSGYAKSIAGGFGVVISPVTSLFKAAEDIPVLGTISKLFSLPFEVVGDSVNDISYPIANAVPGLDKDQRENLRSGLSEIVTLAGQLAIGYTMDTGGKLLEAKVNKLVTNFSPEDVQTIVSVAQNMAKNSTPGVYGFNAANPIDTPSEIIQSHLDKVNNMLQDPDLAETAKEQLPSMLPAIKKDIVDGLKVNGNNDIASQVEDIPIDEKTTFESFSKDVMKNVKEGESQPKTPIVFQDVQADVIGENKPKVTEPIKPAELNKPITEKTNTEEPTTISKAAADINTVLVEKGFQELPATEQSSFTSITKEDQIQKVADIIKTDLENAQSMARGETPVPSGVNEQVLFNAIKNKAIAEGDAQVLRDLANSPIAKRRSEAAQSLGAAGFQNFPEDPVKAMQDIKKTRDEAYGKRVKDTEKAKDKDIKEAKQSIKNTTPKAKDWESFINEITC